ncbi:MAG: hypothetical protein IT379_22875, partial [Deltaproteobacteria bacterium]|nr:hypothetical protein [Deltaproteobacteria bacterium]
GTWSRETVAINPSVPQSVLELADGRVGIAFIEWLESGGNTIRFAFSGPDGWTVADGPACGCYDVELVERDGVLTAVYEGGGNLSLGTFVAPDGVDDDCDGAAW